MKYITFTIGGGERIAVPVNVVQVVAHRPGMTGCWVILADQPNTRNEVVESFEHVLAQLNA